MRVASLLPASGAPRAPALSLRCGEDLGTEFATMSFVDGQASMKVRTDNFPITLPGLAPLLATK